MCYIYKFFGAHVFGQYDLIKKVFSNLPYHSGVIITMDFLKMDSWDGENFKILVDSVEVYMNTFDWSGNDWCGDAPTYYGNNQYNEKIINIYLNINPHTSSSLTIQLQSNLDQPPTDESYGIQNFKLFLVKDCADNCFNCDSGSPNYCTKCPFFSAWNNLAYKCVCKDRFYMETNTYTRCEECDITCYTCNGPSSTQCISCFSGDTLVDGACIPQSSNFSIYINIYYIIFFLY